MVAYNKTSWPLRLAVEVYGWVSAAFLISLFELSRFTCRFEVDGEENLRAHPHAIWACWHEFVVCSFVCLPRFRKLSRPQVWLNHPAWMMRPIHRVMGYYGIDVVMGASGERGREAAAEVLKRVQLGETTSINPDGPAGPKRALKKGVLLLARESGIPVLTFHYNCPYHWNWPGWDRKIVPLPFSTVRVRIRVMPVHFEDDETKARLEALLS